MTKRRFFAPGYSVSTRGHSVLRRGTYGASPRRVFGDAFAPEYIPRRIGYESTAEEYALDSAITNATSYSDASLFDTYDTASKSRGRDQALLQNATAAIVSSEAYATPKTSVAARRVARKANQQSVQPQAKPIPTRTEAAIVASKVEVEPRRKRPRSKFAAEKLRTTRARGELPQLELGEGSNKVDPSLDLPQLRRSLLLQENVYTQPTSGLTASRPPVPLPSDRRAIRDVEGFTKPRNLLSWQYRLDSRMDPADLIYKPGSFSRMREQVREAHDKMDRHRQMLDRYLTESGQPRDIQGSVQRKMEELERRDPSYRGPKKY